jgi:hypothetical protein
MANARISCTRMRRCRSTASDDSLITSPIGFARDRISSWPEAPCQ